jgi:hypothetical protein
MYLKLPKSIFLMPENKNNKKANSKKPTKPTKAVTSKPVAKAVSKVPAKPVALKSDR